MSPMRADPLISIVIPVYRSAPYLDTTVTEVVTFFEPRARFEVILVNDASPDAVQDAIDRLCARDPRIRALTLDTNVGQHRATLRGLEAARGDVVVTIDDDGQNPPAAALAVAEELDRGGFDAVYGTFEPAGQSRGRRIATAINTWLSKRTLPNPDAIPLTNVRALRGDLARELGTTPHAYPYIEALVFRMTTKIGAIPVEHRPRSTGSSNYTLRKLLAIAFSHVASASTKRH